ncbi:AAA family ATPase [Mycobacterium sp. 4D054]
MSFSDIAAPWRAAGWLGTIPLPEKAKNPPPVGWTGRNAGFATDAQIAQWCDDPKYRNPNLGLHLGWPVMVNGIECEVLGIDVDHYLDGDKDKLGGDQLAALESQLGTLPPTWVSTARARNDDGTDRGDWTSGIRFFLVPRGLAFRGQAAADIEVIQKNHRFAVVWPSFNPKTETTYRLFSPQSWSDHGHGADGHEIPDVTTLPVLPDSWVDYLTQGRMRDSQRPIDADSSLGELEQWALKQFQDAETLCPVMRRQLERRKRSIAEDATSHDKVRDAHWEFLRLATEGHTGWLTAINEATEFWIQDVTARDKRSYGELRREIFRSLTGALRKFKSENGSQHYGKTPCVCSPIKSTAVQGDSMYAGSTRNAPLDLRELRTVPPEPISWLLPDMLPCASYVSLSAAPGTGKSVLSRAIAVEASLGRSAFDPSHEIEPARVIYLDAENGPDWWRDGLDSMGAPLDLPNLSVVCYPDVGGLDTAKGSAEFLTLISDLAEPLGGVDLVVLETVSRFIDGGENDADTWSQFYRLAIQPLRDQKVAVLRLDHLGKDADKGPRGSSHKLSDVDADFRMTAARAGSDELTLKLGKRRRQHFVETLSVRRKDGLR